MIARIEAIAQRNDKREPLQQRIHDLWLKQNILLNVMKSDLEEQGAINDASTSAINQQERVSKFNVRLAFAKMMLSNYKLPETTLYTSKVGTHRHYDSDEGK